MRAASRHGWVNMPASFQEDFTVTSLRSRMTALAIKYALRPRLHHQHSPESQRRALELFARMQWMPRHVAVEAVTLGARPAEKLTPEKSDHSRALLYLHGGGFMIGNARTYRSFAAYLARACGCPVYVLDYRLAPEHPFPAAQLDALAAFRQLGTLLPADRIALAGDSAGAGLCLSLMLELKAQDQPMPACAWLACPFADLTLSGASIGRNRHLEPLLTKEWLDICCEYYAAETPRDHPQISPIFADLSGLPPLLIQAAGNDLLLDDARRVHALAKDAGVDSKLEVFADLGHDFQTTPGFVPEAGRALAMAAAYLKIRQ